MQNDVSLDFDRQYKVVVDIIDSPRKVAAQSSLPNENSQEDLKNFEGDQQKKKETLMEVMTELQ